MKSGYKDYLDQYTNLVNQPTWADNVGDAYTQAGSQPAQGASQRSTNALLLGVGAGLKGGAAQDRQKQLSPMLQQAGQITAKAAELEAQAQQEQGRQFAVQEFGQKYTPLVATFADLVNNNDPRSVIVFKDLISKAGSIPGYENLEAESWDASKGYGLALNTQTGEYRKITADEIISAIAPSAQAIYGDKWFEKFLPLNAGVAKDAQYAFNTNREATELGLNEKRAGIANQYSQANQHNATADSTRQEMNAPKAKYSDSVVTNFVKTNSDWVNGLRDEHKRLDKEKRAYEEIAKIIEKEDGLGGRAGSSAIAQVQRAWNNAGTESEKNQALLELYKQPLMAGMKQIFAGATSDKDIAVFIAGLPALDKNPEASIQVAKERAKEIGLSIESDNITKDVLENDFGYSEPYNSLAVQDRVQNRLGSKTKSKTDSVNNTDDLGIKWDN